MNHTSRFAVLALAAAAAACGTPAGSPDAISPELVVEASTAPPVHALVGHRGELQLTSEQVAALDSIGDRLHRLNAPLDRELRAIPSRMEQRTEPHRPRSRDRYGDRERRPPPRAIGFADPERAREILTEMRENNRRAESGVAEVLTEAQREQVCAIFDRRVGDRRQRDPAPSPWSWCRAAEEDGEAGPQNGL